MDEATALNLRHLRIFAKVAELRGIRKAADAVSLSQPAVTQAIAKLEAQVGATLFERSSNGTYLREAGAILAFRTGLMFRRIEEALTEFGVLTGRGTTIDTIVQRVTRPQIRVLMAVASSRSFPEVARKHDISPVSLHRAARDLERNLGKPLFDRSPFGVVTTAAAAELARKIALALREIEWATVEIQAAEGRLGGELRIGAMPLAGGFLLGSALNSVAEHFPHAHTHVRTGDGRTLADALRIGEIDFIVGMSPKTLDPSEINQESLVSSPFVLIGRRDHPLSRKGKITLNDLASYEWVVATRGATRRIVFDTLFASMGRAPKANIEANSLSTIRMLISGSDRLTLMTRFEFEFEAGVGALVRLPFAPIGPAQTIGVAWRAGWTPTVLHLKFLELIRMWAAQVVGAERSVAAA